MSVDVTRQAGALGAYVSGVDLAKLDDALFEVLHEAFLEHHVICVRDQDITPADQLAFAERWGEVFVHPYVPSIDGYPGIMEIGNPTDVTVAWHSDTTHAKAPPRMSQLLARKVPAYGGDTAFANQHLAYEGLSEAFRALIDGLGAVHAGTELASESGLEPREVTSVHPVVRRHPDTGRPALFVNADYVRCFEGMTEAESHPLLEFLYTEASRPEYTWRHKWRAGDLLMWDNASVQHCVIGDVGPGVRTLHRITIEGEPPV